LKVSIDNKAGLYSHFVFVMIKNKLSVVLFKRFLKGELHKTCAVSNCFMQFWKWKYHHNLQAFLQ